VDDQPQVRILKSTSIIGSSSILSVIFRIVQVKAAAVILGPAGVGLISLFNSATALAGTISAMGLPTSGVRQIAEAAASDDESRLARTVVAFRRVALFLAVVGALVFLSLRTQIAQVTFGSSDHSGAIGILSLVPLVMVLSGAQSVLLRGLRRIGDLARATVIGGALGTLISVPILYLKGPAGIVPYLISIACAVLLANWWYARKIQFVKVSLDWRDVVAEARPLLRLGSAFMVSGLVTMATLYLVRVVVTRQLGVAATGLYEATMTLSNVYVGFILAAMGADFYPHLSAVAHDDAKCNQLINSQIEVGLLLATPGLLVMLALGPYLLRILYSEQFVTAFDILRWQVLGTFLRVITWPLGFLLLARAKGRLFLWTELATNLFYLGMVGLGIRYLDLTGLGMAFWAMYLFHLGLMNLLARRLSRFHWSGQNLRLAGVTFAAVLAGFSVSFSSSAAVALGLGLVVALAIGAYCLKALYVIVGRATVAAYLQRIRHSLGCGRV
jgi:PST family polysaccharide transporter